MKYPYQSKTLTYFSKLTLNFKSTSKSNTSSKECILNVNNRVSCIKFRKYGRIKEYRK